jgi:pyruvate dehydrogenase E2 component (dihydrolipoamide acetyltransferase)
MSTEFPVNVPDIGDFEDVDVIEILVHVGDTVAEEDPLITLESDKAMMDIPAPRAGRVAEITVTVGDKVSEGSVIAVITAAENESSATAEIKPAAQDPSPPAEESTAPAARARIEVAVPDIGDFEEVDVIEILVQPGDSVAIEDPLITLESDKATMDIPAPVAGQVEEILVAIGDKVSQGHVIATVAPSADAGSDVTKSIEPAVQEDAAPAAPARRDPPAPQSTSAMDTASAVSTAYASPSIRKFARELGVDLTQVSGSGRKGRIVKSDVQAFIKSAMSDPGRTAQGGFPWPQLPPIDFAKFGPIETQSLTKIKRLTGQNLHRSWVTAPHVTQFDEADVTELEAFRTSKLEDATAHGVKLTLLAFLIKAVVVVLDKYPDFNSSLTPDGESIVHKKYFHIGIAVNTDRGLVVPVIRDADQKGLYELAGELREVSVKAREKKLMPADMQGGCFTISNLGGVGGTAFTPIINVPEVAILGVSPSIMKPVYVNDEFVPRLMLPYALSFDHRVIDGVAGAQFTDHLGVVLSDIRHILL